MRNFKYLKVILIVLGFLCLTTLSSNAEPPKKGGNSTNNNNVVLAPNASKCDAPSGYSMLAVNNVRCRVNSGGYMFYDKSASAARYEIPKNSQKHSIYCGSLWVGGTDVNGQNLRLAATTYSQSGRNFWTGPLSMDGNASIEKEMCRKYDRIFKITRAEVEEFIATKKSTPNIKNYPGNGDLSDNNQSHFLAPFYDANGDFLYNPNDGDYPYYDLNNKLCSMEGKKPSAEEDYYKGIDDNNIVKIRGTSIADQILKGDETLWWVFNDKGNDHADPNSKSIGMEIRAQAFGFSTSDEVNNMTFYTYELINRSSIRLFETYFSQWVDTDLGDSDDDWVGCDVKRGLGYCYNGTVNDGDGAYNHYGADPPAVGIDYFQGPYMDPDGIANPGGMCDESINGVGFGDTIIDNERLGMQRFVYHNREGSITQITDPDKDIEYYNLLKGIWKDGNSMKYGGNGYNTACGGLANGVRANFMFPGETDPCNWGTKVLKVYNPIRDIWEWPQGVLASDNGIDPMPICSNKLWTEDEYNNPPSDRRFMQSSGPFTLEPGAVNYITVGIPWARATGQGGDTYKSVVLLKYVDDKAQLLFDNCFRVINGPDAPNLIANELDREVILYIENPITSNNYNEKYLEGDYNIITPPSSTVHWDSIYRFEGYQIFQLKDESVSPGDLWDRNKARIVKQCDIENYDKKGKPISRILNYNFIPELNSYVGQEMVNGENKGIVHSFRVFNDEFSTTTDKKLVNHKKYYYMAVAYAYNEYKKYSQNNNDSALDGQKKSYLSGRKSASGPIKFITVIPHKPQAGSIFNSTYGDIPEITKLEGQGNGGNVIDLTDENEEWLVRNYNVFKLNGSLELKYKRNSGPINVRIVDPLKVQDGEFMLSFDVQQDSSVDGKANWKLYIKNSSGNYDLYRTSDKNIELPNEQFLLDYGIAINIRQVAPFANLKGKVANLAYLESSITFEDSTMNWLTGIPDNDECENSGNWIRCGTSDDAKCPDKSYNETVNNEPTRIFMDGNSQFEKIVNGTWSIYRFAEKSNVNNNKAPLVEEGTYLDGTVNNVSSIDVVFTKDTSLWTRCPVVEVQYYASNAEGSAKQWALRKGQSVNKMGQPDGSGTGMGWFPGYAINIETGERLNILFTEDSKLISENGRDMIWNPTSNTNDTAVGGRHFIYVFAHVKDSVKISGSTYTQYECPAYDGGTWLKDMLAVGDQNKRKIAFRNAMYVTIPILNEGHKLLSNDCKVRIRVSKPYGRYYCTQNEFNSSAINNNYPLFKFSLKGLKQTYNQEKAENDLDLINVVPNPYYAYDSYEFDQLDNRIKITNLPKKCTVKIYNLNGELIRDFTKDDEVNYSIEWDLKNKAGIKVASGMYLIHVKADGIGERVIKWFGVLRPADLNSF